MSEPLEVLLPELTLPCALLDGICLCDGEGTEYVLRLKPSDGTASSSASSSPSSSSSVLVGFVSFSGSGGRLCHIEYPLVLELLPRCPPTDDVGEQASITGISLPFDQVVGVDVVNSRDVLFKTTMGPVIYTADSGEGAFECKLNISSCIGTVKAWRIDVHGETWEHTTDNYLRLYGALSRGDVGSVQRCLDIGCPPDMLLNDAEETPLDIACRQNKPRIVQLLLSAGASLIPNEQECSVLFKSAMMGWTDAVRAIITWICSTYGDEHLMFLLTETDRDGFSIFHAAAKNGDADLMTLLCDSSRRYSASSSALMLQLDPMGRSLLHIGAQRGSCGCLKYLLSIDSLSACINLTDLNGETCLDLATGLGGNHSNRGEVVLLLESAGAKRSTELDHLSSAPIRRVVPADLRSTSTQTSPDTRIRSMAMSPNGTNPRVLEDIRIATKSRSRSGGTATALESTAVSTPPPRPSSFKPTLTAHSNLPIVAKLGSVLAKKKADIAASGLGLDSGSGSNADMPVAEHSTCSIDTVAASTACCISCTPSSSGSSTSDLSKYDAMFKMRGLTDGAMFFAVGQMQADGVDDETIRTFKATCRVAREASGGKPSGLSGVLQARTNLAKVEAETGAKANPLSSSGRGEGRGGLAAMLQAKAKKLTTKSAPRERGGPVSVDQRRSSRPLQRTFVPEGCGNAALSLYSKGSGGADDSSEQQLVLDDSSILLLEELFAHKVKTVQLPKTANCAKQGQGAFSFSSSASTVMTAVLCPKRSYTMCIALSSLKRLGSHEIIIGAISSLDLTDFTPANLYLITQKFVKGGIEVKTLLPSDEESVRARSFRGSIEALPSADKWCIAVVNADERFEEVANVALTVLTFEDDVADLMNTLEKLISACVNLRSSGGLEKLLKRLLEVACVLNESYSQPKKSLALDGVMPLGKKKGSDNSTTLFDVVVNQDMVANEQSRRGDEDALDSSSSTSSSSMCVDFFAGPLQTSVVDASKIDASNAVATSASTSLI